MISPNVLEEKNPPVLRCQPLDDFDSNDWQSIARAFQASPKLRFSQHWLGVSQVAFRPAWVRLGWRGDRFHYFAELQDDHIHTVASHRNEQFYTTGDVFELFAGAWGDEAYIEHHVSPNNQILQLRFPNSEAIRSLGASKLEPYFIHDDEAVLRARVGEGKWWVYGELPAGSLPGAKSPLEGTLWQVSFCRYDYAGEGTDPVLSSTSPHEKRSYHRRHEWRLIEFVA